MKYCDVQYRQNTQSSPASTATLMVQSCWCRQMPQGGAVTVGALTARLLSALLISSVLPQSTRCFLYPDRTVTIQVGPIKTFCTCNDDIRQWKFQTGLVLSPCLIYQPWARNAGCLSSCRLVASILFFFTLFSQSPPSDCLLFASPSD